MLLYLKYANHFNYQKEGFFLLVSVNAAASPKIASQLVSYPGSSSFFGGRAWVCVF